jgi:hypothetical protein
MKLLNPGGKIAEFEGIAGVKRLQNPKIHPSS